MIHKILLRAVSLTTGLASMSITLYWFMAMALYGRVILLEPDPVILVSEIVLAGVLVAVSAWTLIDEIKGSLQR